MPPRPEHDDGAPAPNGLLVPHRFGPECAERVRAALAQTWKPLGARLLEHHDIGEGATWALVPRASPESARPAPVGGTFIGHPFEWPEPAADRSPRGWPRSGATASSASRTRTGTRPTWRRPSRALRWLLHGRDVYEVATAEAAVERIAHLLRLACAHDHIGVVSAFPAAAIDGRHDASLDGAGLNRLAQAARAVLVGGWDEEGLIFWEPPPPSRGRATER